MEYPLNLRNPNEGFALANDEDEHKALSERGYEPRHIPQDADPNESDSAGHTVASVRTQLDGLGVPYDKRLGVEKLLALLPA